MEKLKKILKWPTMIVSVIIFIVSLIGLVLSLTKSYSYGKYSYSGVIEGEKVEIELTLKGDETVILETLTDPELKDVSPYIELINGYFRVYNNELYIGQEYFGYTEFERLGKFEGFKLVIDENEFDREIVLKNNGAYVQLIAAIVFLSLSVIMIFISLTLLLMPSFVKKALIDKEKTIVESNEESNFQKENEEETNQEPIITAQMKEEDFN